MFVKVCKFITRYVIITVAALIYASGVALFLDPNDMAPGGMTGISVLLNRVIPLSTGVLIFLLNIPIMILGAWKFGIKFICSTIYTLAVSAISIDLIAEFVKPMTNDRILAALVGGAMLGIGMGMVFRQESTTGGADIIVKVIRQKYQHIKTGEIFLAIDGFILVIAALVFRNIEIALYAGVAIFISTIAMDKVLYGADGAKLVYIVSDKRKILATRMMQELRIGVTLVKGRGAYTMENKEVIMCVMRKQRLPKVRKIVREVDPQAFMIISSATEVFGEGFKGQNDAEL